MIPEVKPTLALSGPEKRLFSLCFAQNDPPKGDKNGTGNEAENEPGMEPILGRNWGAPNNYIEINNYHEISKSE